MKIHNGLAGTLLGLPRFPADIPCRKDRDAWTGRDMHAADPRTIDTAIALCQTCPALKQCRQEAAKVPAVDKEGMVWAGTYFGKGKARREAAAG